MIFVRSNTPNKTMASRRVIGLPSSRCSRAAATQTVLQGTCILSEPKSSSGNFRFRVADLGSSSQYAVKPTQRHSRSIMRHHAICEGFVERQLTLASSGWCTEYSSSTILKVAGLHAGRAASPSSSFNRGHDRTDAASKFHAAIDLPPPCPGRPLIDRLLNVLLFRLVAAIEHHARRRRLPPRWTHSTRSGIACRPHDDREGDLGVGGELQANADRPATVNAARSDLPDARHPASDSWTNSPTILGEASRSRIRMDLGHATPGASGAPVAASTKNDSAAKAASQHMKK